jgi:tetratricopeptide (TPR) repeat protein
MPAEGSEIVKTFLRAQNLEQLGRVEEAIALYESAVQARFDSSGPYDRLIFLYADSARHGDVIRVAEAAISNVHTYQDKKAWYERMRTSALKAQSDVPASAPKKRLRGDA